jgi:hypothetical protein
VNISSVLGRVGNATNGSVSPQHDRPFQGLYMTLADKDIDSMRLPRQVCWGFRERTQQGTVETESALTPFAPASS